jgi:hypothetical protein
MHMVLPASASSPRFCRSLSTLLINDYEPVIINWGGETHHSSKIFKLLEYLQNKTSAVHEASLDLPSQCADERGDIVISMDAYDIITQRPLDGILAQFNSIPARIVYSAEKGCHPPNEPWCSLVPDSPLPNNFYGPDTDDTGNLQHSRARFLNSGIVIGYARDMLSLYTDAAAEATRRAGNFHADQSIFGPLYTSKQYNMTLDFLGVISTPFFFFEQEVGLQPAPAVSPVHRNRFIENEVPWNLYNRVTHQFPAFVHFNGNKAQMDDAWRQLLWGGGQGEAVMVRMKSYLEKNVSVSLDSGVTMSFRELCPGNWQREI